MLSSPFVFSRLTQRYAPIGVAVFLGLFFNFFDSASAQSTEAKWEPCGWGGGGWYWATVFHPTKDGVIYLAQDVGGVSKSTDHGQNWRMINVGLTDYGVYSLAVDRSNPETVYADTEGGLHKSIDGGEHWQLLPGTGRKELRITAERSQSVRSIAVDPTNGQNLYAASPGGKVYKSIDGGQTWTVSYEKKGATEETGVLRAQFGGVNGAFFGGLWLPLAPPASVKPEECVGIGFSFRGGKVQQKDCFLMMKTNTGASYRSKNLTDIFKDDQWQDIILTAQDFTLDPDYAKKNPDAAKALASGPNWTTVTRVDFSCSGAMTDAAIGKIGKFFLALNAATDGRPTLVTLRDFSVDKAVQTYGNIRIGNAPPRAAHSVAVAAKLPSLVVAATDDSGLVLSEDAGKTWRELDTPHKASSAVFCETDPAILYGAFEKDGVWKSVDTGKTWTRVSDGLGGDASIREVAVSPVSPLDVYAIGSSVYLSKDGGKSWKESSMLNVDLDGNPTLHYNGTSPTTKIGHPMNVAINPNNPKELFISADWRSAWSGDGGLTWSERERGSDISCITDIRFSKGRAYATAMDEGTLMTENNGKKWHQLWPLKYIPELSGHYWRVAVDNINGIDRIISNASPWNTKSRRVVLSQDGGKTFKSSTAGLPDYTVTANTMWGQGHPRALVVDPNNPKVVYLGLDGDASEGNPGGGIFKSEDGGENWKQLPNQPGSRRMFYGLAVDPTDSKRIFWGSCGTAGGLYRSEDGGTTWSNVFNKESWIFNVLVTQQSMIYCPGKQLWRSVDHGKTWTQLTHLTNPAQIMGLEVNPLDPKTVWISSDNGVLKTSDGGNTWQDITGNLPYRRPQILRFNPETSELWAGWVGLYRTKQ